MTGIQPINSTYKKPLLRADNTGYAALAGLALTTGAAFIKNKSIKKTFEMMKKYLMTGIAALFNVSTETFVKSIKTNGKSKTNKLVNI